MRKMTFALAFCNRSFMPGELICGAREDMVKAVTDAGYNYIMMDEELTRYLVPIEAVQKVFCVIEQQGMPGWNGRSGNTSLDGKKFVCQFPDGNDSYTRVSSDDMPHSGKDSFLMVKYAIDEYATDEYRADAAEDLDTDDPE